MDAPPIQYCRTEDGVNLAYWTLGERSHPALIIVPWGIGHLTVEWEIAQVQAWYERLARRFFLVAYDARGSGLSQRSVTDLTLAQYAADIAAIAQKMDLDGYTLQSAGQRIGDVGVDRTAYGEGLSPSRLSEQADHGRHHENE